MEVRKNKEGKNVFIVYSQGNFISASEHKNSSIEMILDIRLRKDGETGEVLLNKVTESLWNECIIISRSYAALLGFAFTRNHHSEYQTLEEMNRMLADNFKFVLQAY